MNHSTRTILELFVEKATELKQEDFIQFITEFGHQLNYEYRAEPQQITVSTVAPTHTMNKSFLLTYRMFVQRNEHMRIIDPTQPVSTELFDPSLSTEWLEQLRDVTAKLHAFLREIPSGKITIQTIIPQGTPIIETPTRWDILETLLYGYYSHASQRERLNRWLAGPFKELTLNMLMMEFRNILAYTTGGIVHLADYAQKELALS